LTIGLHDLPALNATLNGTAAILLVTGYTLIRKGRRDAHRVVMITAFTVSSLFLVSYLT
jgi:putative membrane protein